MKITHYEFSIENPQKNKPMRIKPMFIPENFTPKERADFVAFINFMMEMIEKYGDKVSEGDSDNKALTPE